MLILHENFQMSNGVVPVFKVHTYCITADSPLCFPVILDFIIPGMDGGEVDQKNNQDFENRHS
jgi:hypothetical protein